jgi:hypothetical protein
MTGSLQIKNNKYYAVLNVIGDDGKRKQKWITTNLEVKGNKKKAAKILVLEFNNLLSPQMDVHQIEDLIQTIYNPGPMTRAFAKQIADDFVRKHR